MLSLASLQLAASLVATAAFAEVGVPIRDALADKPTPPLLYEIAGEKTVDPGHKNHPQPDRQEPELVTATPYERATFQVLQPYHGASEVMLGLDTFQDWASKR